MDNRPTHKRGRMDIKDIRLVNLEKLISKEVSATVFAHKIEMSPSQLSQIRNPKYSRSVGNAMARRVEKIFALGHGWMDRLHDEANRKEATYNLSEDALELPKRRRAPIISYVQAGNWCELVDAYPVGTGEDIIEIDAKWSPNTFVLRVRGDSMHPTLTEGALIVVDPQVEWMHNRIVVVRQNGDTEVTVKRLIKDGDTYYLKPDNTNYPIMRLEKDAHVCGVVVELMMKFV